MEVGMAISRTVSPLPHWLTMDMNNH
jgi:hypothetical protein